MARAAPEQGPEHLHRAAEDGAALAGLVIAAAGVWLSHAFDEPAFDGLASVLIGPLLAGVGVVLIQASRKLLVGEGIRPDTTRKIHAMARQQPSVHSVGPLLSMYVGAEDVLLTLDLAFEPSTAGDAITASIAALEQQIRTRWPRIRRIYIEPQVSGALAPRTARSP